MRQWHVKEKSQVTNNGKDQNKLSLSCEMLKLEPLIYTGSFDVANSHSINKCAR